MPDSFLLFNIKSDYANLLLSTKNYEKSMEIFQELIDFYQKKSHINNLYERYLADALSDFAGIYYSTNQIKKSEGMLNNALQIYGSGQFGW
jgi:tetratricopeptide (TPR) repeat protein